MKKSYLLSLSACACLALGSLCFTGCSEETKDKSDYERIEIKSADDLFAMEEGKFYILTCDLDLQGRSWKPLTVDGFDGDGHAIKNFNITEAGTQAYSGNGTYQSYSFLKSCRWFENLTLENVTITATQAKDDSYLSFGAAIAAYVDGITVKNSSATMSVGVQYFGGVAARVLNFDAHSDNVYVKKCHLSDCTVTASKTSSYAGGISAYYEGPSTIEDCSVTNLTFNGNGASVTGGIAGHIWRTSVTGCVSKNNTLIGGSGVGGIVGEGDGVSDEQMNIKGCLSQNNSLTCSTGGGIAGRILSNLNIANCLSRGNTFIGRSTAKEEQHQSVLLGGLAGSCKSNVTRSSLSVENSFQAPYNGSSKISPVVASNGGSALYIGTYANNFEQADARNVSDPSDSKLSSDDLISEDALRDKLKLDKNLWEFPEGEYPTIKTNF